jgi:predicted nucleotidyltransferase
MIDIEKIKIQIIEALKPLNPEKVILFGSYAYGIPNENSDLDICVIENTINSKIKEKSKIRKALKNIKMSKDILLETTQYFLSHSDEKWINTALYDARHKGVILYEQK